MIVPERNVFSLPPDEYVLLQLGSRVRILREARGMTQAALAEQLGFTNHTWVAKLEAGSLAPSPGRLRALCLILDCCPSYLLFL